MGGARHTGAGIPRDDVESALAAFAAGSASTLALAPTGRTRLTVTLVRTDEGGLEASIPRRGKGYRDLLPEHGWFKASTPGGSPYYRRVLLTPTDALAAILDAYVVVYGEVGDTGGWSISNPGGSASPSADGGAGSEYLVLIGFMVALGGALSTFLGAALSGRSPGAGTIAVAFVVACLGLVGAFLATSGMVDGLEARHRLSTRDVESIRSWPILAGIIAGTLAAGLGVRLLEG